jgi:acyl-CoA synthetase (AMP-forming)/AMP-acid ligase II
MNWSGGRKPNHRLEYLTDRSLNESIPSRLPALHRDGGEMERRWYAVWDPRIPKVFEPEKSLLGYFSDSVQAGPERVAISFYGRDVTYDELNSATERFAWGLAALGIKKGDRVALFMQNCPQFVIGYYGILRAGAVVVAINPMFKHAELEYQLRDAGVETVVALDSLVSEVKRARERIRVKNLIVTSFQDYLPKNPILPLTPEMSQPERDIPESLDFAKFLDNAQPRDLPRVTDLNEHIALLQYTGGTTGLPKGATITHYTLAHNVAGATLWFGYTREDVHMGMMPFSHVQGMTQAMNSSLFSGGRLVILARFTPEALARVIEYYKGTIWKGNTTMVIAMIQWPEIHRYDLSSLRLVTYGGAPMPTEIIARLRRMLPRATLGEGYGLTETLSGGGVITPLHRPKPGFIGIPFISTDLRVVDLKTGVTEVKPNEEGEITISGATVMKGYWNNPDETALALRDGWLYTGDIGRMDEEGYLTISGRKKELIKCSGFSVFPTEVEDLLYKHPAVAEVAVIGVPDAYRGEAPKAFIVLKREYTGKVTEDEIAGWARDNMATYKRPRMVEFRDELPKSGAGKILRRLLAEDEAKRQPV